MPSSAAKRLPEFHSLLLDGLTARERADVMSSATLRGFRKNEQISAQGFSARQLFLVRKGCARFFSRTPDGTKIPLSWVGPGDPIGGMAIVSHPSWYMMGCEALTELECFCWEREAFRKYFARYPRLSDNAILIAAGYVEWLVEAYVAIRVHSARERLADALLAYAHGIGERERGGIVVDVTNEDLAQTACITKYTTCRLLAEWQRSRVIAKQRGKIVVLRPEVLETASPRHR